MEVKFIKSKDRDGTTISLVVDSISVAQEAVKDIVGRTITEYQLNGHAIYASNLELFLDFGTAKKVFKNLCKDLYKGERFMMNIKGGHINDKYFSGEILETYLVNVSYKDNLHDIFQQQIKEHEN